MPEIFHTINRFGKLPCNKSEIQKSEAVTIFGTTKLVYNIFFCSQK